MIPNHLLGKCRVISSSRMTNCFWKLRMRSSPRVYTLVLSVVVNYTICNVLSAVCTVKCYVLAQPRIPFCVEHLCEHRVKGGSNVNFLFALSLKIRFTIFKAYLFYFNNFSSCILGDLVCQLIYIFNRKIKLALGFVISEVHRFCGNNYLTRLNSATSFHFPSCY